MGRPMARHLLEAGGQAPVQSRSRGPGEELVAAGARDGGSPAGVGAASDVVILMLPDPPDVHAVIFDEGLTDALAPGSVIVDMSTGDPLLARDWAAALDAKGIALLDAPVSGGMEGAQQATLSIMVGGSAAALDRARPLLEAMGRRVVHVGESGAGLLNVMRSPNPPAFRAAPPAPEGRTPWPGD